MATPGIKFTLKRDGYALLSLDHLEQILPSGNQRSARNGLSVPPRRTPFFDQDVSLSTSGNSGIREKDLHRTWYIFFEELLKRLNGTSQDALVAIRFLAPSIDEEDMGWWGEGTLDASTDPVTDFAATVSGSSRYGTTFQPGDFIVWDAPFTVGGTIYHEIDQIVSVGDGNWTIKRREQGAPGGQSHFGSLIHAQSGKFYRLEPYVFLKPVLYDPITGEPNLKLIQEPWPNKCVVAVRSWGVSLGSVSAPYTLNLTYQEECPGWRTLNGAEYTSLGIAGTLVVDQRAAYRVPVAAWHSVRFLLGSVKDPPHDTGVTISVVYIAPGDDENARLVGLVGKFTIPAGAFRSFTLANRPDGKQMPAGVAYPPNLLPNCGTLGALAAPVTPGAGAPVLMEPDGEIDLVVESIGSTGHEGADLVATVQN